MRLPAFGGWVLAVLAVVGLAESIIRPAAAEQWAASHQFPAGDPRDQAMRALAVDLAAVGLDIRVFPEATLLRPRDQLSGLKNGSVDLVLLPSDYMVELIPQLAVLSLPGLVRDQAHAARLSASPPMRDLYRRIEAEGAVVIGESWAAGAIGGRTRCIQAPTDVLGLRARVLGPYFSEMWAGAGAAAVMVPTSEMLSNLLEHGLIDIANTSTTTLMTLRPNIRFACLTLPGPAGAIWYFHEPILLSRRAWDALDEPRRQAVLAAGARAGAWLTANASRVERQLAGAALAVGTEVIVTDSVALAAWHRLARRTAWKRFREQVPGGGDLIDRFQAID
jgi:TRAP-type C4-dicarboxylate transport system substrate-binding protein